MPPPSDEVPAPTYHRARKPFLGAGAGLAVGLAMVWAFVRWRPFRVDVAGASMAPTLLPGDWALAVSTPRIGRGDVVVVEHPGRPGYEMVKRVTGVPGDRVAGRLLGADEWWIEGDHAASSTDSRHFGPVRRDRLMAKVLLVYAPRERRRLIRSG